jgi:hypothetical protein
MGDVGARHRTFGTVSGISTASRASERLWRHRRRRPERRHSVNEHAACSRTFSVHGAAGDPQKHRVSGLESGLGSETPDADSRLWRHHKRRGMAGEGRTQVGAGGSRRWDSRPTASMHRIAPPLVCNDEGARDSHRRSPTFAAVFHPAAAPHVAGPSPHSPDPFVSGRRTLRGIQTRHGTHPGAGRCRVRRRLCALTWLRQPLPQHTPLMACAAVFDLPKRVLRSAI